MEIWTHDNSSSGLNLRVLFSDFILDLGTVGRIGLWNRRSWSSGNGNIGSSTKIGKIDGLITDRVVQYCCQN